MIATDDDPYVTYYCEECGGNPVTYDLRLGDPDIGWYICDSCRRKMDHWVPDLSEPSEDDDNFDDEQ